MDETMKGVVVRPVADSDSAELIALIDTVCGEYPNYVVDVEKEMPELKAPARAAEEDNARWWVAEAEGTVVASCAVATENDETAELKRLFVARSARRRGLAAHFMTLAEREARQRGAKRIVLWSDTRFAEAHELYERLGYARQPRTRALPDISKSIEFQYVKDLR
jgi:GNAT superfamily N-acetyltransferase